METRAADIADEDEDDGGAPAIVDIPCGDELVEVARGEVALAAVATAVRRAREDSTSRTAAWAGVKTLFICLFLLAIFVFLFRPSLCSPGMPESTPDDAGGGHQGFCGGSVLFTAPAP